MATTQLIESAVLTEASPLMSAGQEIGEKGIWRTRIIEADVQGSSGYYPADVLKRDGPTAFPAGTHVYLDHPTHGEDEERPERSVKDLAGYLVDGAQFEESGNDGSGLFARIQFIPEIKERIKALAPVIGLSIRAAGEVEESGGRRIVRSIAQGLSVDVVTRAGAGGRLVNMTESTASETSPAQQTAPATGDGAAPSTTGSGVAIVNEVASLREALSDKVEQQALETARMNAALKESQKSIQALLTVNRELTESVKFLKERQEAADQAQATAKNVGEVAGELIKSGLPVPSLVRIAESYQTGQDLHEAIQHERDYLKKILRESERSDLNRGGESSGLGLTESIMSADLGTTTSVSTEDFSEMDTVLSGKLY